MILTFIRHAMYYICTNEYIQFILLLNVAESPQLGLLIGNLGSLTMLLCLRLSPKIANKR